MSNSNDGYQYSILELIDLLKQEQITVETSDDYEMVDIAEDYSKQIVSELVERIGMSD